MSSSEKLHGLKRVIFNMTPLFQYLHFSAKCILNKQKIDVIVLNQNSSDSLICMRWSYPLGSLIQASHLYSLQNIALAQTEQFIS